MHKSKIILLLIAALLSFLHIGCTKQKWSVPPIQPPTEGPGNPATDNKIYVSSVDELNALTALKPGDTVVLRNGTYPSGKISVKASGQAAKPLVIKGEQGGKTILTGQSYVTVSGSHVVISDLYFRDVTSTRGRAIITLEKNTTGCTVTQCAITGTNTPQDPNLDYKWVSLYGQGHTVTKNTFTDKRNIGCLLVVWMETGIVPQHTISGNYFSRPVSLLDGNGSSINGQETIRIGTSDFSLSDAGCTVESNHFYQCDGETEAISNKSCANVYRNNLFTQCKATLTLRHGNNCLVEGNFFLGEGISNTGGIRLIGAGHTVRGNYLEKLRGSGYKTGICLVRSQPDPELTGYWQVKDALVENNTLVDCRYAIHANYGSGTQTEPVITTTISNNTIYATQSSDYTVYCYTSPAPDITWTGNIIFGGRQSGVSLPTQTAAPEIPPVRVLTEAIAAASGTSWTINP